MLAINNLEQNIFQEVLEVLVYFGVIMDGYSLPCVGVINFLSKT